MKSADGYAYERRLRERERRVCARLRTVPGLIQAAEAGRAPVVTFTCPGGHGFRPVRLGTFEAEYPHGLQLEPLPGQMPKRARIRNGSPFGQRSKHSCEVPRCPGLLAQPGTCDTHGARQAEWTDDLSNLFRCGECGWHDTITTARQLELYGGAVVRQYGEVALNSGRPTRRA